MCVYIMPQVSTASLFTSLSLCLSLYFVSQVSTVSLVSLHFYYICVHLQTSHFPFCACSISIGLHSLPLDLISIHSLVCLVYISLACKSSFCSLINFLCIALNCIPMSRRSPYSPFGLPLQFCIVIGVCMSHPVLQYVHALLYPLASTVSLASFNLSPGLYISCISTT